jgi:ATP-binding protein involved in chromosome partitioning
MNNPYNIKGPYNPNPPKKKEEKKKRTILDLDEKQLTNVDKIIAIASGKGGVGKSTVAVNLAITLARMGSKVGLADADVYGPSVPKMTGTEGQMPGVEIYDAQGNLVEDYGQYVEDCTEIILPIEKFGVKWMSIGYFAKPEQALIWRGPMACNALKQMILQVKWGELDFLLIDLPPGTGDIHISLVHDIPLDGAIIVSTPQAVALSDVEKGVNLFRNENINKHIYGIIENMSWFTPAELPENRYYIFGKDGCKAMAEKYNLPLLGQVPIVQSIREGGDEGTPAALHDGPLFDAMKAAALQLLK